MFVELNISSKHAWMQTSEYGHQPISHLDPKWPSMGQINSNTKNLVGLEETAGTAWDHADPKWLNSNNSNAHILLSLI